VAGKEAAGIVTLVMKEGKVVHHEAVGMADVRMVDVGMAGMVEMVGTALLAAARLARTRRKMATRAPVLKVTALHTHLTQSNAGNLSIAIGNREIPIGDVISIEGGVAIAREGMPAPTASQLELDEQLTPQTMRQRSVDESSSVGNNWPVLSTAQGSRLRSTKMRSSFSWHSKPSTIGTRRERRPSSSFSRCAIAANLYWSRLRFSIDFVMRAREVPRGRRSFTPTSQ
jgi:hypothetical protein